MNKNINMKNARIKSIYAPAGDLNLDYIMLHVKAKLQMTLFGDIDYPQLLEPDVTLTQMLNQIYEDTQLEVKVIPKGPTEYLEQEFTYKQDFWIIPNSPDVDMAMYVNTFTEDLAIAPIALEYTCDDTGYETVYETDGTIDFEETRTRFIDEFANLFALVDFTHLDNIGELEELIMQEGHLYATINMQDVVCIVYNSASIDTDDVEVVSYF